ncbi:MAG: Lpg1974 family pore-forming outer membrane protein [Gemmataceae bacterium]
MKRSIRFLPSYSVLAVLLSAGISRSEPPLPAAPVPFTPADQPSQQPVLVPAVPGEPYPGQLPQPSDVPFPGQSLPADRWDARPEGLFATLETSIVGAHVKNRLANSVQIGDLFTDTVRLPSAELGGTVSPRFELGYRLPEKYGEFLASYRFLISDGTAHVFTDLGPAQLKSRINLNEIDLDYVSREFSLAPSYDLRWRLGSRLAGVFFDSRLDVAVPPDNFGGGAATESISNNFLGAGPHFGLDLSRRLDVPGAWIFTRVDGAVAIGRIHQGFDETFTFATDSTSLGGATTVSKTQAVPMLGVQFGVAWSPFGCNYATYSLGYEFEQWWNIGRAQGSMADLTFQGVFFRAEFSF